MSNLKFREGDDAVRPAKSFALDRTNGKMMGVCSGIARYFDIDATWVRLGFVAGTACARRSACISPRSRWTSTT